MFTCTMKPVARIQCVVRLKTETYFRGNTLHQSKTIRYLKRKSLGESFAFDTLREEHYEYQGEMEIENLYTLPDGLYHLIAVYSRYDEEYTFKLEEIKDDQNKFDRPTLPL